MGHFSYMCGLAAAISGGLALYDRKTPGERIYRAAYLLGAFALAIFGVAWLMYGINP